ncbi:hypothetical protein KAH81_05880 [bacterium]|nr:hypothetical protein [bacterium]
MNLEYFQALEEKVNLLINKVVSLRNENNEIAQANKHLEEKVQNMLGDTNRLKEENQQLLNKANETSINNIQEGEIKNRLEEILRKVDEVVES